jgi:hypothetical protein
MLQVSCGTHKQAHLIFGSRLGIRGLDRFVCLDVPDSIVVVVLCRGVLVAGWMVQRVGLIEIALSQIRSYNIAIEGG